MAFIAKTFISPSTELDNTDTDSRGNDSLAKKIEDWLTGASALTGKVTVGSCHIGGERVHVTVVAEIS